MATDAPGGRYNEATRLRTRTMYERLLMDLGEEQKVSELLSFLDYLLPYADLGARRRETLAILEQLIQLARHRLAELGEERDVTFPCGCQLRYPLGLQQIVCVEAQPMGFFELRRHIRAIERQQFGEALPR